MSDKTFKQQVEEIIPDDTDSSQNCPYQFKFKGCSHTSCKKCIVDRILAAHNAKLDRIAEGKESDGVALIAQERKRTIEAEGWTAELDKQHCHGELSMAATCYALVAVDQIKKYPSATVMPSFWPWHPLWWKPTKDPIRNLVKAGALIAAEIDRCQAYIQAQKEGM